MFLLVYIDKDSTIVEIVDFNTKCWGYIKGYVYFTNIHTKPPSKERQSEYYRLINTNTRNKKIEGKNLYDKPSEYGITCW